MDKQSLTERDICTKLILPAVKRAGWDEMVQVREEVYFTKGRIIVRGKLVTRGKAKKADVVLYYKPNIPIAVIEAKDNTHSVGHGIQQGLTPQGKYWADIGLFFEYSHANPRGSANSVKFGPDCAERTSGFGKYALLHTANLLFEKEIGPFSTARTGFVPAWQSRVLLNPFFEPGFEIYGNIDDLGRAGKFNDQQYNIGPMFAGSYVFAPYGKIRYELGYLFGATSTTPRGALRWRFEYEIAF